MGRKDMSQRRAELAHKIGLPEEQLELFIAKNRDILSECQYQVITRYYAIGREDCVSFSKIASEWGVTRGLPYLLKEKALRTLKKEAQIHENVPSSVLDYTTDQFFTRCRAQFIGLQHRQLMRILTRLNWSYGHYDKEKGMVPPLLQTIVVLSRVDLQRIGLGSKSLEAIEAMLETEGLILATN